MKKLNIYIKLFFPFIFIVACNDSYMEKYPLDKISDFQFWNTSSDLELYANQFYPYLKAPHYNWRNDDNSDNNAPANRHSFSWGEYVLPASGGGWGKDDWLPIRRCNYALVRAEQMAKDDKTMLYVGEIRFFRALFYHQKVKRFGDVPWLDKDLGIDSEELFGARESRKLIFDKILEDLDFAISHLPEESTTGRLTKYAALTFKAEAALFEGTFRKYHKLGDHESVLKEGAKAAEEVINSGRFGLYTTGQPEQDYFDLFVQYELKGNPEGIMIQRFVEGLRMHNNVREMGESKTGYSKDFVNSYLCKDGLPIGLSAQYKGDAVFGDEFENRDPRMKQSIYHPERPYRVYEDGGVDYRTMPEFDNNYVTTSYIITKGYSFYERDRLQLQCTIDDFIFRYGKLLVTYAEIKAELNECTQDVLDRTINKLRERVDMPALKVDVGFVDPNWPKWEEPVSALVNEIRRERRIETAGEGMRWDDLMRWKAGKLLENELTMRGARDPKTGDYRVIYPGFTRKWDNKLYLYPIPSQERGLNPALNQNPGWES